MKTFVIFSLSDNDQIIDYVRKESQIIAYLDFGIDNLNSNKVVDLCN